MSMLTRSAALAGVLTLAVSAPITAQSGRISLEAADCSRMNMTFGDGEVARAVQHATVPVSSGALEIRPEANCGGRLECGSGDVSGVAACIAVGARSLAEAQAAADNVRLVVDGNRIKVAGTGDAASRVRNW